MQNGQGNVSPLAVHCGLAPPPKRRWAEEYRGVRMSETTTPLASEARPASVSLSAQHHRVRYLALRGPSGSSSSRFAPSD